MYGYSYMLLTYKGFSPLQIDNAFFYGKSVNSPIRSLTVVASISSQSQFRTSCSARKSSEMAKRSSEMAKRSSEMAKRSLKWLEEVLNTG